MLDSPRGSATTATTSSTAISSKPSNSKFQVQRIPTPELENFETKTAFGSTTSSTEAQLEDEDLFDVESEMNLSSAANEKRCRVFSTSTDYSDENGDTITSLKAFTGATSGRKKWTIPSWAHRRPQETSRLCTKHILLDQIEKNCSRNFEGCFLRIVFNSILSPILNHYSQLFSYLSIPQTRVPLIRHKEIGVKYMTGCCWCSCSLFQFRLALRKIFLQPCSL